MATAMMNKTQKERAVTEVTTLFALPCLALPQLATPDHASPDLAKTYRAIMGIAFHISIVPQNGEVQ